MQLFEAKLVVDINAGVRTLPSTNYDPDFSAVEGFIKPVEAKGCVVQNLARRPP